MPGLPLLFEVQAPGADFLIFFENKQGLPPAFAVPTRKTLHYKANAWAFLTVMDRLLIINTKNLCLQGDRWGHPGQMDIMYMWGNINHSCIKSNTHFCNRRKSPDCTIDSRDSRYNTASLRFTYEQSILNQFHGMCLAHRSFNSYYKSPSW